MKGQRIPSKIKIKPHKQSLLSEKNINRLKHEKIYLNKLILKNKKKIIN
jgi:hypothetical protein